MTRIKTLLVAAAATLALAAPTLAQDSSYLEDRIQIEDLMARYIFALDWRDAEGYAATFTEDGTLNYGGGQAVGREAIAAMVEGLKEREAAAAAEDTSGVRRPRTQHFVTNIVLDIADDGQSAKGWAYWVAMSNNNPERAAQVSSYGHYIDELRKVDGAWLFVSRQTVNEQVEGRHSGPASPVMGVGPGGL
jgi:uncharacterized protein (TIGR02246 family)